MQDNEEVTHKEIYVRLCEVEAKVDKLQGDTASVVQAFNAAQGAFIVLEWLGKIAKPLLWLIAAGAVLSTFWNNIKVKL
jgi:hypothetical protein